MLSFFPIDDEFLCTAQLVACPAEILIAFVKFFQCLIPFGIIFTDFLEDWIFRCHGYILSEFPPIVKLIAKFF